MSSSVIYNYRKDWLVGFCHQTVLTPIDGFVRPNSGNLTCTVNCLKCGSLTFRRSVQSEPQLEPAGVSCLDFLQLFSQQDVLLGLVGQKRSGLCSDTRTRPQGEGTWPGWQTGGDKLSDLQDPSWWLWRSAGWEWFLCGHVFHIFTRLFNKIRKTSALLVLFGMDLHL